MPFPLTEKCWNVQIDGKLTFYGVLDKYFEQMGDRYHLCAKTRISYAGEYERHILPRVNDRPLECLTAEDFEQIIIDIKSEGKKYAKATLQHYRLLISRVIDVAVQKEKMKNPLWGVDFEELLSPEQVEKKEKKTLPKSLTPLQMCAISEEIYSTASTSGRRTGLMNMMESGIRPKETAGASFGDVREMAQLNSCSTVAIHSSTIEESHKRKNNPKTKNGYRTAVIGPRSTQIIQKKKEELQKCIDEGKILDDVSNGLTLLDVLPIASSKDNPSVPCTSSDMTKEFRHLLRDINYDKEDYLAAQRIAESDEFQEAEGKATPSELGFAIEKDPTAYIFRRQYCTDLHIVGCCEEEIQYAMGHKIDNAGIDRRDFRNEDKITLLAEKVIKRPFVNKDVLKEKEIVMIGTGYQNKDFHSETIRVPIRKGKMRIRIRSHEPLTSSSITFVLPENVKAKCCYYQTRSHEKQRKEVNVLNDYYDSYRKAYEELEKKKEK